MVKNPPVVTADLRGINRLAIDGIAGVIDVVEGMHHRIARVPAAFTQHKGRRTRGITRLISRIIRGGVGIVGHGLDRLLARLEPMLLARLERATWGTRR